MITLVLGGARSGKSVVGEQLAARAGEPVTYVATGVATDADMARRIARHRERRPAHWETVEVGRDLPGALASVEGTVLVDALGTWVAGLHAFEADREALCHALVHRSGHSVVVSEEVGLGVHPSSPVGRAFRDALGDVNRAVAAIAD